MNWCSQQLKKLATPQPAPNLPTPGKGTLLMNPALKLISFFLLLAVLFVLAYFISGALIPQEWVEQWQAPTPMHH